VTEPRPADQAAVLIARPVKSVRIAVVVAIVVAAGFIAAGVDLPDSANGIAYTAADQYGIGGVGLLCALGVLMFLRPRLRADNSGVEARSFLGGYRHVDWDLVNSVEFPPKARFARLVLPGDELITLYAVQRGDGERSVLVMQQLRALHVANH
jgi:hypothetical protein